MPLKRLRRADYRSVPWKNGLGVSQTLVQQPPAAGFDTVRWQVGITDITSDCPFSALDGLDRTFLVLSGAGVELTHATEAGSTFSTLVKAQQAPHRFRGDWPTTCRLLGGPVKVLNIMARRGEARAEVGYISAGRLSVTKGPEEVLVAVELEGLDAWLAEGPQAESCELKADAGPLKIALIKILEEDR